MRSGDARPYYVKKFHETVYDVLISPLSAHFFKDQIPGILKIGHDALEGALTNSHGIDKVGLRARRPSKSTGRRGLMGRSIRSSHYFSFRLDEQRLLPFEKYDTLSPNTMIYS